MIKKILYMRELALTKNIWSTEAGNFRNKLESDPQTRIIRKAMSTNIRDSVMLEQISLRISGYLRMINTREAHTLASKFDNKDSEFTTKPIHIFEGLWQDQKVIKTSRSGRLA